MIATDDDVDQDLLRGRLATLADLAIDLAAFATEILHDLEDGEETPHDRAAPP